MSSDKTNSESNKVALFADKFLDFINSSSNNQVLVLESLKLATSAKEWPHNEGAITNSVLPLLMGAEASSFLVFCLTNGIPRSLQSRDSELGFLKICLGLFRDSFIRSKAYAKSPMAYAHLSLAGDDKEKLSVIKIGRADGENLDLVVTPESMVGLIKGLIKTLDAVEELHQRTVDKSFLLPPKSDI